ncbi:hypothetical protein [Amycolatopsis sp. WAC 04169]|uniref:hypothetical protein n=1 Tax=Amycolatopsis sp. WAC 04169 TaxID=2203197 RepID=UPI000F782DE5|nr:hypothetical protein [Amycolatopsis sp. WAC 04169]
MDAALEGDTGEFFSSSLGKDMVSGVEALGEASGDLASMAKTAAADVVKAKVMMVAMAAMALATIVHLLATLIGAAFVGLAQLTARQALMAVWRGLVARMQALAALKFNRELGIHVLKAVGAGVVAATPHTVKFAVAGAGIMGGLDLSVQTGQIAAGKRDELDGKSLLGSFVGGALGGAFAGIFHAGAVWARGVALESAGKAAEKLAAKEAADAVDGAVEVVGAPKRVIPGSVEALGHVSYGAGQVGVVFITAPVINLATGSPHASPWLGMLGALSGFGGGRSGAPGSGAGSLDALDRLPGAPRLTIPAGEVKTEGGISTGERLFPAAPPSYVDAIAAGPAQSAVYATSAETPPRQPHESVRDEGRARVTLEARLTDEGRLPENAAVSLGLMVDGFVDAAVQARTGAQPHLQGAVFVAPGTSTGTTELTAFVESRVRSRLDEFPAGAVTVTPDQVLAQVSISPLVRPPGDEQLGLAQVRVDGQRPPAGLYGPGVYSEPGDPLPAYRREIEEARAALSELESDDAVFSVAREIMSGHHQPPRLFIEEKPPRAHEAHRERHQAATDLVAAELIRPGRLHTGEGVVAAEARARSLVDAVGWPREGRILGGAPQGGDVRSPAGAGPSAVPGARPPEDAALRAFWERLTDDGGQMLSNADESAFVRAGLSGGNRVVLVDQLTSLTADPLSGPTEMSLSQFGEWLAGRDFEESEALFPAEPGGTRPEGEVPEPLVVANTYGEENLITWVPDEKSREAVDMWRNSGAHTLRFILRQDEIVPVALPEPAPWARLVADQRPLPLVVVLWPRDHGFQVGKEILDPVATADRLRVSDVFQRFLAEPVRRPLVALGWTEDRSAHDLVADFVTALGARIGPVQAFGYQGPFKFWEERALAFPPGAVFKETFGLRPDHVRHVTGNGTFALLDTTDRSEVDGALATAAVVKAERPGASVMVLPGDDTVVRARANTADVRYPLGGEEIVRLYLAEPGLKAELAADPHRHVVLVGDFGDGEARPGGVRFDVGAALAREGLFNPVYAMNRDATGDAVLVSGLFADRIKTELISGPEGDPVALFVRHQGDERELARVRAWATKAGAAGVRTLRRTDGRRMKVPWQVAVPIFLKPAAGGQVHLTRSDGRPATGEPGQALRDSRQLREALGRNEAGRPRTPLLIPLEGTLTGLEKLAADLAAGGYARDVFAARGPVFLAGGQMALIEPGLDRVDAVVPGPSDVTSYALVGAKSGIHGAFFPRDPVDIVNQWRVETRADPVSSRIYFSEKPGAADFGGEAYLVPGGEPGWRSVVHGNESGIAAALPTARPYELGDQVLLQGDAAGAALFGSSVYRAALPDPDRPHVLFACNGAGSSETLRAIESRWGKGPVVASTAKTYYGWNGSGIHVKDDGHLVRADEPQAPPVRLADLAAENIPSKLITHGAESLPKEVHELVRRAVQASAWRLANGGEGARIQVLVHGSDEAEATTWGNELATEIRDTAEAEAARLATRYELPLAQSLEILVDFDDTGQHPPVAEVEFHLARGSFGAEALKTGGLDTIKEAFSALDPASRKSFETLPEPPFESVVSPDSVAAMANLYGEQTLISLLPEPETGVSTRANWAFSGGPSGVVVSRTTGRAGETETELAPWADTFADEVPGPLFLTLEAVGGGFQVDGREVTVTDAVRAFLNNETFRGFRQEPVRGALAVLVRDKGESRPGLATDFLGALREEIGPVHAFAYQGPFSIRSTGLLEFPREAVFGESLGATLEDVRHVADGDVFAFLDSGDPREAADALVTAAAAAARWARTSPDGRAASVLSMPGDDFTFVVGWVNGEMRLRTGGGEAARLYLEQPGAREALASDPARPVVVVGAFTAGGTRPGTVPFEVSVALAREGLFNPVHATTARLPGEEPISHQVSGLFADRVKTELLPDAEGRPAAVFVRYEGDEAKLAEVRAWARQEGAHGVFRVTGPDGVRFEPPWRGKAVPIVVKPAADGGVHLLRSDDRPVTGELGPALRDSPVLRAALGRVGDGSVEPRDERAPLVLAVDGAVTDLGGFARELASGGYSRTVFTSRGPAKFREDGALEVTDVAFDRVDPAEPEPGQMVSYPLRNVNLGNNGVFFPANVWDLATLWRFDATAGAITGRIYLSRRSGRGKSGDWYLSPAGGPGWRGVVHGFEDGVKMALSAGRRHGLGDQVHLESDQASAALFASAVHQAARPDPAKPYRLMACRTAVARRLVENIKNRWGTGTVVAPTAVIEIGWNGRGVQVHENGHLVRVDGPGQLPVRLAHLAAERTDPVSFRLRPGLEDFPDLRLLAEFAARPTAWRLANGGEPATLEIRIRGAEPGSGWADTLRDVARVAFDGEAERLTKEFGLPDATGRLAIRTEFTEVGAVLSRAEITVRLPEGDFGLAALESGREDAIVRAFAALTPDAPAGHAPAAPRVALEGKLLADAQGRRNLLDLGSDPEVSRMLESRWDRSSDFDQRILAKPVRDEEGNADYAEVLAPWAHALSDGSTPVRFLVVDAIGSPLDAAWRVAGDDRFQDLMSGPVRPRLVVLATAGSVPAPPAFAERFTRILAALTGPLQGYHFTGQVDLLDSHGVLVADPAEFTSETRLSLEDLQPYENETVFGLRTPGDDTLTETALAVARAPELTGAIVLFASGAAPAHFRAGLVEHAQEAELTGAEAGRMLLENPRLRELLGEGRRVVLLSEAGADRNGHGGKGFDLVDALLAQNFHNDVYAHTGPVPAVGEGLDLVGVSQWRTGEVKTEVLADAAGRPAALFVRYPGDTKRFREVREWVAGGDSAASRFYEDQDGQWELPGRPVPLFLGARSAGEVGAIRDNEAGEAAALTYADVSLVLRDDPDLRALLGSLGHGFADPAKERWLMPVSLDHPLTELGAFHEGMAAGGYSRWTRAPRGQVTLLPGGVLGVRGDGFTSWKPVKPGRDNVFSYPSTSARGVHGQFFPIRDFEAVQWRSSTAEERPAGTRFYASEVAGPDGSPAWRVFVTPASSDAPWVTDVHGVADGDLVVALKTGHLHRRGDVVAMSDPATIATVLYGNAVFDSVKPAEVLLLGCHVAQPAPNADSTAKRVDDVRVPGTHKPAVLIAPTAPVGRIFDLVPAVMNGKHLVRLGREDLPPLPAADLVATAIDPAWVPGAADGDRFTDVRTLGVKLARAVMWHSLNGALPEPVRVRVEGHGRDEQAAGRLIAEAAQVIESEFLAETARLHTLYGLEPVGWGELAVRTVQHVAGPDRTGSLVSVDLPVDNAGGIALARFEQRLAELSDDGEAPAPRSELEELERVFAPMTKKDSL